MYKLIVSDLDETLLNSNKDVSDKDIEAIRSLKDVRFVLATGRGYESITNTLKQIDQYDKKDTYSISYNGGMITENKDNRVLFEKSFDFKDAKRIFELGKQFDVCMHVYVKGISYVYKIYENEKKYISKTINYKEIEDIDCLSDTPILKVLYGNEDMKYLETIRNKLNLEDDYEICFSANRYLEFNPKGVNKAYGIRKLCELLGIDISESIAIGDSTNDLSMIKEAGLGVAVSNAVELIKENADVILQSDHNSSPISELIDKYIKNEG